MAVYVDTARHPYRGMIMCHLWADSREELLAFVDQIGIARRWVQEPPRASWLHFDINLTHKQRALAAGAIQTDKYGPLEHVARLKGDGVKLARIEALRHKFKNSQNF